ncbi:uncharacterized protein BP01DRAFT_97578 [Aspergillus saccharolyticus JOP 1030-1]|uniref:Uncharacterized protein n=1 Tax=Aspergillus saccharolyticus JOP 1030-1 TaxID=1450539 RepID=A0A318ZGK0_9EURO|nr:hypothetical protein BP01DRAFT_97578 [Aspergillus saccharolyticus JOP 1030-1]PYH43703.1 hypothetical protein BP01DRAFT_97578 [Aspergillus saccharolyticus JOP 1030-1]
MRESEERGWMLMRPGGSQESIRHVSAPMKPPRYKYEGLSLFLIDGVVKRRTGADYPKVVSGNRDGQRKGCCWPAAVSLALTVLGFSLVWLEWMKNSWEDCDGFLPEDFQFLWLGRVGGRWESGRQAAGWLLPHPIWPVLLIYPKSYINPHHLPRTNNGGCGQSKCERMQ